MFVMRFIWGKNNKSEYNVDQLETDKNVMYE